MKKILTLMVAFVLLCGCSSTTKKQAVHYLLVEEDYADGHELTAEEKELKKIDKVFTGALEEGAKLLQKTKKSNFTTEELSDYKKYFIWGSDQYLANKFLGALGNTMDGYDGKMTYTFDKWIDIIPSKSYGDYLPLPSLNSWYGGEPYYDESIFSNVITKSSSLSDEDKVIYFESFEDKFKKYSWYQGIMSYETEYANLREYTEREHGDADFVKVYGVQIVYKYKKPYPKNAEDIDNFYERTKENITIEQAVSYSALPSNVLDVILVKTNDGWKILECRWLFEDLHNVVDVPDWYK